MTSSTDTNTAPNTTSANAVPGAGAASGVASPPLLELKNLSRFFKRKTGFFGRTSEIYAVNQVNLQLERGETLGLVGESGSGKSTLARMAVRLLTPSIGDVLLEGKSIFSSDKKFRCSLPGRIQMVFQDPYSSLDPRLRVGSSIGEALSCAGVSKNIRREKIKQLLNQVGLEEDCAGRFPHEFSGGQRQRMSLARALAPGPDIIVCDEPVSSLDASVQAQVLNLLKDNQEKLNLSYLFISHDLAVVSHMSDRIAVMYAGSIVELGTAADIFSNPRHPYTSMLLSASDGEAGADFTPLPKDDGKIGIFTPCAYLRRCPCPGPLCDIKFPELKTVASENFDSRHVVRCWNTR